MTGAALAHDAGQRVAPAEPRRVGRIVAAVAGLGAMLPLGSMAVGLALPSVADAACHGIAVFIVTGAFCGTVALRPGAGRGHPATGAFAVALGLLGAALAWVLALLAGAGAERAAWVAPVALVSIASVSIAPGAIGFAAAMGHAAPRFAGLVLSSVVAAVGTIPLAAFALGIGGLAAGDAALRLLLFSLLPIGAALLVRRAWTPSGEVRAALLLTACVALALQALARVAGTAGPLFDRPLVAL